MKKIAIGFVLAMTACANTQWTVVVLEPVVPPGSRAYGVSGGRQVGGANIAGLSHASMWNGTPGSWVDLNPVGSDESVAFGAHGGQQVGRARVAGILRASLWSGTAGSWVDLHTAGATQSIAYGVHAGRQVGFDDAGGAWHAILWSGTAASRLDLNPTGSAESVAHGMHGAQQVGWSRIQGEQHASLWSGTPASWVDLNPTGSPASIANAVYDGQQAGWVVVGFNQHASRWTGTSTSWVDLHPPSAPFPDMGASIASAVDDGVQVGWIGGGFQDAFACIWRGTAESLVNLHPFLPSLFDRSHATGVWHQDDFTYVVGFGFQNHKSPTYTSAVMWVSRSVPPTSFTPIRGTVFSGNLASLLDSDNNRLVLRPGVVLTSGEPPVQVRINATAPNANPNGISFSVESSASFPFAQQKVSLWNYDTGAYELLDTRTITTSDDTVTVTVRTNAQRFIDNGTLAMRALVSYKAVGPSILYPWSARIDKVWWTFPG